MFLIYKKPVLVSICPCVCLFVTFNADRHILWKFRVNAMERKMTSSLYAQLSLS
jgi:hypothetical protein